MEVDKGISIVYEWSVWASLDRKNDIELIILKGHLIIETTIVSALRRANIKSNVSYSFYKKVALLKEIQTPDKEKLDKIILHLFELNKLRNKLAHEYYFDTNHNDVKEWSNSVFQNFEGEKFARYTHRTQIVQAISTLAKNIFEINA